MDRVERKKIWKAKKEEIWNKSRPEILKRDIANLIWESRRAHVHFGAKIQGNKIELTRHEGTSESYGGRSLLARHLIEKQKWQTVIEESFGKDIAEEILEHTKNAYAQYQSEQNT